MVKSEGDPWPSEGMEAMRGWGNVSGMKDSSKSVSNMCIDDRVMLWDYGSKQGGPEGTDFWSQGEP